MTNQKIQKNPEKSRKIRVEGTNVIARPLRCRKRRNAEYNDRSFLVSGILSDDRDGDEDADTAAGSSGTEVLDQLHTSGSSVLPE